MMELIRFSGAKGASDQPGILAGRRRHGEAHGLHSRAGILDERGELAGGGDLAAQTAQAMRNVGLALAAAGAGYADIVKITTYVVNYRPEQRTVIGKARAPFLTHAGACS